MVGVLICCVLEFAVIIGGGFGWLLVVWVLLPCWRVVDVGWFGGVITCNIGAFDCLAIALFVYGCGFVDLCLIVVGMFGCCGFGGCVV